MRTRFVVAIAFLTLVAVGCRFSEDRYLKRTVRPDDLTGVYLGTPFSVESLKWAGLRDHLDAREHHLELLRDGTCRVQTFLNPIDVATSGTADWITGDAPCRWRLGTDGRHQKLMVLVRATSGIENRMEFYFDEEDGHLILWQYVGDPDSWKYLELRKSASAG